MPPPPHTHMPPPPHAHMPPPPRTHMPPPPHTHMPPPPHPQFSAAPLSSAAHPQRAVYLRRLLAQGRHARRRPRRRRLRPDGRPPARDRLVNGAQGGAAGDRERAPPPQPKTAAKNDAHTLN
eukprot:115737-Prymnesium_polylepis.2